FTLGKVVVYVDLSCAIDKDKIKKEMDNLEKFKNSLDKKLSNKEFVKNAPKDVVEKEQNKLKDAENKLNKLKEQFNNLNSYENKH
ncbi:MAG: hypothetical protein HQ538_04140, partial [Parcubacteria group bacterium]|nr:hypothetical protein [Parcubacteria group bacterium]